MNYLDSINWHPAANLFPLLPADELHDLAEDIRANGLLNPIVLLGHKVLDGRNRLLACKQAGVKPTFTEWVQGDVSPVAWVISLNLHRRHLSAGQLAAVSVEAKPLLAAEAKERLATSGPGLRGGATKTPFLKNEKGDGPLHVEKTVAKQFGVSQGYVHAAQKIKDADEKVFQRLKAGTISIPDAQKELGFKQSTKAMVASDSNEWYTPENYIKAVRAVLGRIELDPASCDIANKKFIHADKFFSVDDDGLKKKWGGKVFLNPPYGDVGPKFAAKLIHEYEAGHTTEAILLVNSHVTDSKWFKPLFDYVLCFTDHRSKFWNQDGIGGAPTHGSVFVYLGDNAKGFVKHFKQFGSVLTAWTE